MMVLGTRATEGERRAYISGYSWGNLRWAQEHCNGSVSVPHIQRLQIDRAVDVAVFDAAADRAEAEVTEIAMKTALKLSGDVDAARFANLVNCRTTEQLYGPHGLLWRGAWIPPDGGQTTAK
jgi:hypothetical protein